MKSIGGYFELELPGGSEYHEQAVRLNSGRNAFEYILQAKKYKKVYLPFYTCDVIFEPIQKLHLEHDFYKIDKDFSPIFDFSQVKAGEVFLYINYFGLCDNQCTSISSKCKNLIIDNSQSFFSRPLANVDTFYSARKFFGVPDGSYLFTDKLNELEIEQNESYFRCKHLLGRIDLGAEKFHKTFIENEKSFIGQPIKKMSVLTLKMLEGINYYEIARKRKENYLFMHNALKNRNQLKFETSVSAVPMNYPFLADHGLELKKKLIENNIYVATYWPNVREWSEKNSFEIDLLDNLISIPIDQRYDSKDLIRIIEILNIS